MVLNIGENKVEFAGYYRQREIASEHIFNKSSIVKGFKCLQY